MTTPPSKSNAMTDFIDELSKDVFRKSRTASISSDICVSCHEPATGFKDELSKKEYTISGLCQKCQDKLFEDC